MYMKSEFAGLDVCGGIREGTCGIEWEAGHKTENVVGSARGIFERWMGCHECL